MTIEYVPWPGDGFARLSDQFVVRGCRARLMGAVLSVECEPAQTAVAAALVDEYAQALRKFFSFARLITLEEYQALPALSATIQDKTALQTSLDHMRLRDARRSIVEPVHSRLSQCYDYFQLARDEPKQALFNIFKLIESIEAEYGGEKKAIRALDDGGLIKRLKRQANRPDHDQRHAAVAPGAATSIDDNSLALLIEEAHDLLRKYEGAVASASAAPPAL
jgi:hypothetical protein